MITDRVSNDSPTSLQRAGMRNAVFQACFASLAIVAFTNGLLLLTLTALNVDSERIVVYLSMPAIFGAIASIPFALLSDRFGKKRLGFIASLLELISWSVLCVATLFTQPPEWIIASTLITYSLGLTLYVSSWFAILSPLVPDSMRGRFFAKIRMSWQSLNIVFASGCAFYLSDQTALPVFGGLFALVTLFLALRVVFYLRIPELEKTNHQPILFRKAMSQIFRTEGFMSFCAYMFLITLATAGAPILYGLIEKRVMGYGDNSVIWLGTLYMVGAMLGFAAGGRMVDRYGTKPVFLIGHFGYAVSLTMFVSRVFWPETLGGIFLPVAGANFIYGFMWAFIYIAFSSEMLALIPQDHKSLSTSVCMTFFRIGGSLSGLLVAWVLTLGMFTEEWLLYGNVLSRYDSILLLSAISIVLLTVTLGLVPSVIHKAKWMPRQY